MSIMFLVLARNLLSVGEATKNGAVIELYGAVIELNGWIW
jgi:hypothetical protein